MPYTKGNWVDRSKEYPNRYIIEEIDTGVQTNVNLYANEGDGIEGTPFKKSVMDDLEDRIGNMFPVKVEDGGTGASNISDAQTNLNIYSKDDIDGLFPLPIDKGGTGATTLSDIQSNLDIYSKTEIDNLFPITIDNGGTGASTAENARMNLGVYSSTEVDTTFSKSDLSNVTNENFKSKADAAGVGGSGGVGKNLSGKEVEPTSGTTVTAGEGAEIFNDYRDRAYNTGGYSIIGSVASGEYSHAEGNGTTASGTNSHAEGNCTTANGANSHAEGLRVTAIGNASHAEGHTTKSNKDYSHAEGKHTIADGVSSHAEGDTTYAIGLESHAEGGGTKASASRSHAEGSASTASGDCSHAEGDSTTASGTNSHSEGNRTTASGIASHTEGFETSTTFTQDDGSEVIGDYAHAEGYYTLAYGLGAHSEGSKRETDNRLTEASGKGSHAEGIGTHASGEGSHSEGNATLASGQWSHAEGVAAWAVGDASHAEGNSNAKGKYSHAEGCNTNANGIASHSGGYYTQANDYQCVIGVWNKDSNGPTSESSSTGDIFIIGGGTSNGTHKNALRTTKEGKTYGLQSFQGSGADYAEYFEWEDGNPYNEDRRGLFVTVNGEKIRKANFGDFIIGVISSTPTVVGDTASEIWDKMYLKDVFGDYLTEEAYTEERKDEQGDIIPSVKYTKWVLNPEYDSNLKYENRESRNEWACVGLVGKLVVIDDGTCEVNGFCTSTYGGKATSSESGFRMLKRIDNNHIKILLK